MEIILKKTIDTLGHEGEIVNVKPGYARNYLIPKNLAATVNKASLARLQKEQQAIAKRLEDEKQIAEALSSKIEGKVVAISRRVGEEDRLFGSVNTADIAEKLAEMGVSVDRRSILLSEPIKSICVCQVPVKVGYQMTTEITVQVVPEIAAEEE
ncbi:MAG: 50S ribosomal protein L9 [Deltaproteobacteria bacterium]|nr:50S ribosomal protein L9 [Deltaproteobacteria bacterium]